MMTVSRHCILVNESKYSSSGSFTFKLNLRQIVSYVVMSFTVPCNLKKKEKNNLVDVVNY